MPSLDTLNRDLTRAARAPDRAPAKIRDAGLAPKRNIHRIGEALARIFDIQEDIYRARPDLLPKFLADTKFGRTVLSHKRLEQAARRGAHKTSGRSGGRSTVRR